MEKEQAQMQVGKSKQFQRFTFTYNNKRRGGSFSFHFIARTFQAKETIFQDFFFNQKGSAYRFDTVAIIILRSGSSDKSIIRTTLWPRF